ncbi:serine protease [Pseudonocardia sp. RS11V-5]|uniref:serine protease n=1 Tax=Pseudonocardia terrae TaxID=2905831 RepID=UPI001E5893D9|nr:serine protease [Pseudonocardia terrae]MCE3552671.1 serine protease [Pseudonocardia terrae]
MRGPGSWARRAAIAGAAAGVAAAAVLLPSTASARPALAAPTALTAAPAPAWASRDGAALHPGVSTTTQGGGTCTSNFLFRGGDGSVYIGQAAHCAGTGESTETDGCTSATMPVGTSVTVRGDRGFTATGTMVYSSWATMQRQGETDPNTCAYNDFALVKLPQEAVAVANPTVPWFGGPTGVSTGGLPAGAQTFSYGNSPVRGGLSALSPKAGVSAGDVGGGWGHTVYTVSPGVPGDSGSAFLDSSGRAIGLLSTLNLAPLPVSNGVSDLSLALAYANTHGELGDVSLVDGTAPFTSTPPGVAPQDLAPPAGPPVGATS